MNDEKELLFSRISFINHSSKPITIVSMTFLDKKMKKYKLSPSLKHDYDCEYGTSISFPEKVEFKLNRNYKDYTEISSTLPITVKPQSSFSGYFAFNFTNQSSYSPVNNFGFVEIETTSKNIIHGYAPKKHSISEEVNGIVKIIDYRWYQGPVMTYISKALKTFRLLLTKEL